MNAESNAVEYQDLIRTTGHRKGVAFLMNFKGLLTQLIISIEISIVVPTYTESKHEADNGNNLLRQFLNKGQSELYGI
jgi:hypothetical protein